MKKILMGFVTFFSVSAFASNFYVQSNILVSGEGQNVLEAQTGAISQGQKQAFFTLMEKIAPTVDITQFEGLDVAPFVQDVSLSDEKVRTYSIQSFRIICIFFIISIFIIKI